MGAANTRTRRVRAVTSRLPSPLRRGVGGGGRHGCLALLLALLLPLAAARADTVNIQGSTTFNTRLIQPYKPLIEAGSGHVLAVVANKSANGLLALLERRTDLAMLSSPLEEEVEALRKLKPELPFDQLHKFEIFNSRIAFAVHPSNPVRQVTIEQIAQMLGGQIGNWRAVGGPDLAIRPVYVRSAGGVTHSVIQQLLAGKPITAAAPIMVETGQQVVKVVAQEPGALGLAQIRLAQQFNLAELDTGGHFVEQKLSFVSLGQPGPAAASVITVARAVAEKKLAAVE